MSILNTLFGTDTGNNLTDRDIAFDIIKDSKFGIISLSAAAAEAVNPQLRSMLRTQLDTAVREHFELSDMVVKKGWYPVFDAPKQQLANVLQELQQSQQSQQSDQ